MPHHAYRWITLLLAGTAFASCDAPAERSTGNVRVSFLRERVEEIVRDVERARQALGEDVTATSSALEDSHRKLRRLNEYYLPLLTARQHVMGALDALEAGDGRADRADSAVDSAEAALLEIVRGHGRHLEKEMGGPLAGLERARTALAADDAEEARRILRGLDAHLESIFYRGNLVLQDSELDLE